MIVGDSEEACVTRTKAFCKDGMMYLFCTWAVTIAGDRELNRLKRQAWSNIVVSYQKNKESYYIGRYYVSHLEEKADLGKDAYAWIGHFALCVFCD